MLSNCTYTDIQEHQINLKIITQQYILNYNNREKIKDLQKILSIFSQAQTNFGYYKKTRHQTKEQDNEQTEPTNEQIRTTTNNMSSINSRYSEMLIIMILAYIFLVIHQIRSRYSQSF